MIAGLATARLALRPLAPADEALYVALYTDPATLRHVLAPLAPAAARRGFAAALAGLGTGEGQRGFWVMQARDGRALGLIGLHRDAPGEAEVGVVLPPAWQGRGLATEAIAALADHAFGALALVRLHTRHDHDHALASGLMAGLGFERVAAVAGRRGWRWQLTPARWAAVRAQAVRDNPPPLPLP